MFSSFVWRIGLIRASDVFARSSMDAIVIVVVVSGGFGWFLRLTLCKEPLCCLWFWDCGGFVNCAYVSCFGSFIRKTLYEMAC